MKYTMMYISMLAYLMIVTIKSVNIAYAVCVHTFIAAERAVIVCVFLSFLDTVSTLLLMFSAGSLTGLIT